MRRDALVYVADVLECIGKIEEYTSGTGWDDFSKNTQTQDAVFRRLEVIGEAVKGIGQEIRAKHPDVPWKEIAGMRDVLIHGYFGVKPERIWKVIEEDLPQLKKNMTLIYRDLSET